MNENENKNSQIFDYSESENLDEKRPSEILSPHESPQKNEFIKPSYQEKPIVPDNNSVLNEKPGSPLSMKASIKDHNLKDTPKTTERRKSNEEIFGEAYIERKKLSFNTIKQWEELKQQFLITHRNFMDNVVIKLEKKIEFSTTSLQKLLKYFKEKIHHETEYCNYIKQKLPKVGEIFTETVPSRDPKQPVEKIIHFEHMTANLLLFDEQQNKNVLNLQLFIDFMDKVICKELIGSLIQELPKKLATKKEKIQALRKQLQKVNVEVVEKSMKHSKLFHGMLESSSSQKSKKVKDLYNQQLQLLEKANIQIDLHRKLGREVLNYWLEILRIQCEILGTIQKVFQAYISNLIKTYGMSPELEISLKKFNEVEYVNSAEEEFKIDNIVTKEESNYIRKFLKINEGKLTLADLEKFFEGFELTKITEKPLILKQILAERESGGLSLSKKFSECLVVFTVDNNILLFDENKEDVPANSVLKVGFVDIKGRYEKDVGFVEITEKVPGILFSSKQSFLLRMKTKNSFEEILDYVRLIAKKN